MRPLKRFVRGTHLVPTWSCPSQNAWVLWFDNPVKRLGAKDWSSNLKKVATFDMVEDFWGVLNNVRPPSRLNPGSNYHLFKSGIEPMWEHTANQAGGKWTYSIPKKDGKKLIDDMWLYTVILSYLTHCCTTRQVSVCSDPNDSNELCRSHRFSP